MRTIINWRVFFLLWIAAILSSIAILPYALELQGSMLESMDLPIPLPAVIALQIVQGAVFFAIVIFAGMFIARRVNDSGAVPGCGQASGGGRRSGAWLT